MNTLKRLISGGSSRASLESPSTPMTMDELALWLQAGATSGAGVQVTPSTAMTLSAVYRAVSMRAGGVASMPLHAFRRDPVKGRIDTTERYKAIWDPHSELTYFEFWELVHAHVDLHGNHYSLNVLDERGKIVGFEPLLPSRVTPRWVWDDQQKRMVRHYTVSLAEGREPMTLGPEHVFHIMGISLDGLKGLSPIAYARESMGIQLAAEKYGAKFFGSGSLMSGILTTDKRIKDEDAQTLKDRWQKAYGGIERAHEIAVLDSGAKFMPVTVPPEDAQFLETRRFGVTDVARWYGVPPHLLMETEKSTSWGSGLEEQDLAYIKHGLQFSLNRIAARVAKDVLRPREYAEHNLEALLKADMETRYKANESAVLSGWKSRADVRREENMAVTDPSLEEYFHPQNAYTASQMEAIVDAKVKQAIAAAMKPEPEPKDDESDEGDEPKPDEAKPDDETDEDEK